MKKLMMILLLSLTGCKKEEIVSKYNGRLTYSGGGYTIRFGDNTPWSNQYNYIKNNNIYDCYKDDKKVYSGTLTTDGKYFVMDGKSFVYTNGEYKWSRTFEGGSEWRKIVIR